jgi:hypothetical protein
MVEGFTGVSGPGPYPTAMATLARTAGLAQSGCTCIALRFRFQTKKEGFNDWCLRAKALNVSHVL